MRSRSKSALSKKPTMIPSTMGCDFGLAARPKGIQTAANRVESSINWVPAAVRIHCATALEPDGGNTPCFPPVGLELIVSQNTLRLLLQPMGSLWWCSHSCQMPGMSTRFRAADLQDRGRVTPHSEVTPDLVT
jgi:hypothetical protein